MSKNYQKTINDQITFKGIGLHNGKPVQLIVKPAQVIELGRSLKYVLGSIIFSSNAAARVKVLNTEPNS